MTHLDTHVVLWTYNSDWKRLSAEARRRLESDPLAVSPAVGLELEILEEIGRIKVPAQEILKTLEKDFQLEVPKHSFADVAAAASLMRWTHDPFDRMICGHALAAGCDLLTKDATILKHFPRAVW